MKRFAQFVALVLALMMGTQPALAEGSRQQPTCCGDGHTALCCGHSTGMAVGTSTPGLPTGQKVMIARDNRGCCMVSAEGRPMVTPVASAASGQILALAAATITAEFARRAVARRPPGLGIGPTTARYILFHDLRL